MADATNEMTMNAETHWPAMLRMAAAWSQMQGASTTHAMVDVLRSNALVTTAVPAIPEAPLSLQTSAGEAAR